MSVDAHDTCFFPQGIELLAVRFIMKKEAGIHIGAIFRGCRAMEEAIAVDFSIEKGGLSVIVFFHGRKTSLSLHPAQGEQRGIHAENGRGIEHRFPVDVRLIVEHAWDWTTTLA